MGPSYVEEVRVGGGGGEQESAGIADLSFVLLFGTHGVSTG